MGDICNIQPDVWHQIVNMPCDYDRKQLFWELHSFFDDYGPVCRYKYMKSGAAALLRSAHHALDEVHPDAQAVEIFRHTEEVRWQWILLRQVVERRVPIGIGMKQEENVCYSVPLGLLRPLADIIVYLGCKFCGSEAGLSIKRVSYVQTDLLECIYPLPNFYNCATTPAAMTKFPKRAT